MDPMAERKLKYKTIVVVEVEVEVGVFRMFELKVEVKMGRTQLAVAEGRRLAEEVQVEVGLKSRKLEVEVV